MERDGDTEKRCLDGATRPGGPASPGQLVGVLAKKRERMITESEDAPLSFSRSHTDQPAAKGGRQARHHVSKLFRASVPLRASVVDEL